MQGEELKGPEVSVVVPVYRNRDTLGELIERLAATLADEQAEFVFVVDGSPDDSLDVLLEAQRREPRLVVVELERNYGQHAALCAGFEAARGDVALVLDADLQQYPEDLPRFLEHWRAGHDFVSGRRRRRLDPLGRRIASRAMNRVIRFYVRLPLQDWGCPLAAVDRSIFERLPREGEQRRFLKPLVARLSRNPIEIEVDGRPRRGGSSAYSIFTLVFVALDFVVAFSNRPFQRLGGLGLLICALSLLGGLVYATLRLAGWPPMVVFQVGVFLAGLFGFQILILGALGEFTHRVYRIVQGRPFFAVRAHHTRANPDPTGDDQLDAHAA